MRCKTCEYRLWNLNARQCPECGAPFLPSEFEFVINSVQFCCPDCEQVYYGRGPSGHLEPVAFDCVKCGRQLHMDQMVLRPTANIREDQTQVQQNPWLERRKRGRVRAWFATLGGALIAPGRLVQATPENSSVGQAFWFTTVTQGLVMLTSMAPLFLFPLMMLFAMGNMAGGGGGGGTGTLVAFSGMVAACGGFILGTVCVTLVGVVLWGLSAHGLLCLGGQPAHGLGRTYQALCYSNGANIVTAAPCIGFYLSFVGAIWWIVSAVLMTREAQRVTGGRASVAVLAFPLFLVVAMAAWIAILVIPAISAAQAGLTMATPITTGASDATNAVLQYAGAHKGRGPDHAIQLVTGGHLEAFDLIDAQTDTLENDVPVGSTTLDLFPTLPLDQQEAEARAAGASLPPDVIAHRLGDFVFVYHGIDLNAPDPKLWLVVGWPDPDSHTGPVAVTTPGGPRTFEVGLADASTRSVPVATRRSELQIQNALRARFQLPPLPDPATVTHDKPAQVPQREAPPSDRSDPTDPLDP